MPLVLSGLQQVGSIPYYNQVEYHVITVGNPLANEVQVTLLGWVRNETNTMLFEIVTTAGYKSTLQLYGNNAIDIFLESSSGMPQTTNYYEVVDSDGPDSDWMIKFITIDGPPTAEIQSPEPQPGETGKWKFVKGSSEDVKKA